MGKHVVREGPTTGVAVACDDSAWISIAYGCKVLTILAFAVDRYLHIRRHTSSRLVHVRIALNLDVEHQDLVGRHGVPGSGTFASDTSDPSIDCSCYAKSTRVPTQ